MTQTLQDLHNEIRIRTHGDLMELAADRSVTRERYRRCVSAATNLESAIVALSVAPWIPGDVPTLSACLFAINQNICEVQSEIDECLDAVFDRGYRPDEVFRVWCSMNFGRLLEWQRDVLMEAWTKISEPPTLKWLN